MTNGPRRFALWGINLSIILLIAAGPALATPPRDRLAGREAARQAFLASGYQSPTVVVDGTPRALPTGEAVAAPSLPRAATGRSGDVQPTPGAVTSLSTIVDEAGMGVPLGGDDVEVAWSTSFSGSAFLQITSDGRYFGAVAIGGSVLVYRSLDHGETWTLWSEFMDPTGYVLWVTEFIVAEGAANRAMFAYSSGGEVRLAYADIDVPAAPWTIVTVLSGGGVTHGANNRIDIATDAEAYSSYFVYVVAQSDDGNGDDIWFARSVNMGTSFEPGYRIATSGVGGYEYHSDPSIDYGFDDYLHVSWSAHDTTPTAATDGRYRRAASWADGGVAAWQAEQTLTPQLPTGDSVPLRIGASVNDGHVFVTFLNFTTTQPELQFSTDSGATWPVANRAYSDVPQGSGMTPVELPGGNLAMIGAKSSGTIGDLFMDIVVSRSTLVDPTAWGAFESFSHHSWPGGAYGRAESLISDPAFGNRLATLWVQTADSRKVLRFDAEWRRDPGYPNTDIGFPIAISGGGQTPPAVAEVDGDPQKEIVFATISGDIHVVNHDGTPVSGWPVNIGAIPYDAPVAVGDLVGNGIPYVVCGNAAGQVYAFKPDGTPVPGWPVSMNAAASVYVSIGALGPPNPRYVVAVCNHEMRVIRYDGTNVSPAWGTFTDAFTRPAAIGDIDNDGVTEIVTLKGAWFHANRLDQGSPAAFRNFPGEVFSDAPTLADIDGNGTLEIAAPTVSGKMFLLKNDGTNYSASWPITVSPGIALTSAAMGQILGTSEPELVFGEATGAVHVRYFTGAEQTGYPLASGSSSLYMPPMLSPVNVSGSNVNVGTTGGLYGTALSWRNIPGSPVVGWPKNLPGFVEETFASGDIDLDGRNELVVLGLDFLTVLDVGTPPMATPRNHWPMYGYNAQRTGCLACADILTGVGDEPGLELSTTLNAHPNPFNPATTIEYDVARAGTVSLEIFDVAGHRVATLINREYRPAGHFSFSYNAKLTSGVYFARLRTAGGEATRKILLLK